MTNEISIDGVRAKLSQLEREIVAGESSARAAESVATEKHEELQRANQEALAAQKTADDANALVATKKASMRKSCSPSRGS
jgi:hypothetical protein